MNNETKISSLKYLITLVFDKLINKIDIFIETQLKTLNEKSVSSNDKVVDFLRSKDNYFNLLRDVFINEIELVKKDSFKNAVESFEEYSGDIEIFLASSDIKDGFNIMKTFCFLVQQPENDEVIYLVKTDCYLSEKEIYSLKYYSAFFYNFELVFNL